MLPVSVVLTGRGGPELIARPIGIGSACAAAVQGRLMDIFYRREETRVGGDFRQYPERFRVERARFIVAIPFITYAHPALLFSFDHCSVLTL